MIEISRTQDEEVGDGTTSVIILGNVIYCSFKSSELEYWKHLVYLYMYILKIFAFLNVSTNRIAITF